MKIISTRVHGILDYIMGALLIVSPWLFGFAAGGAETWIPVLLGAATIIYSLLTDYELGASAQISMKTHLGLDAASGLLLAASPWLFGFSDFVYLPHLILGILELGAVALTETTYDRSENKDTQLEGNYGSEQRKESNKAENFSNRKEDTISSSPQKTASTSMHNNRNNVHKVGIHNKDERPSEKQGSNTDNRKNNKIKSSEKNINNMPPQHNQNRDHQKGENNTYANRPAASVENPMKQEKSGGNRKEFNSRTEERKPYRTEAITNRNPNEENLNKHGASTGDKDNSNNDNRDRNPEQNPHKQPTDRKNIDISSKTDDPTDPKKNQNDGNQGRTL